MRESLHHGGTGVPKWVVRNIYPAYMVQSTQIQFFSRPFLNNYGEQRQYMVGDFNVDLLQPDIAHRITCRQCAYHFVHSNNHTHNTIQVLHIIHKYNRQRFHRRNQQYMIKNFALCAQLIPLHPFTGWYQTMFVLLYSASSTKSSCLMLWCCVIVYRVNYFNSAAPHSFAPLCNSLATTVRFLLYNVFRPAILE